MHNKWVQQSGNKMTSLYEMTMDDLICAFMHIAWLRGGYTSEGLDSTSLKMNVVVKCGDPKLLVDAMKSYAWVQDLNTKDCTLEMFEHFGSTKHKFILPPCANCHSHQSNKANYSFPRPNTRTKITFIEEFIEFCKAWCGTYHIGVRDWLCFFPIGML